MPLVTLRLELPRYAVSPRQVARAGDLWRLAQETAVLASTEAGWPPERYVQEGTAFVVYEMVAHHHREVTYGEVVTARTWVRDVRRGVLSRREVRLAVGDEAVFSATQHWVHVGSDLKPKRGSQALVDAFPPVEVDDKEIVLDLPPRAPTDLRRRFTFEVWHTWMDPLGHVNHPTYLDFCDEATSRIALEAGADPQDLVPVAELVTWKGGAVAGQTITVVTHWSDAGNPGLARFDHDLVLADGTVLATATTLRRLSGRSDLRWLEALGSIPSGANRERA